MNVSLVRFTTDKMQINLQSTVLHCINHLCYAMFPKIF